MTWTRNTVHLFRLSIMEDMARIAKYVQFLWQWVQLSLGKTPGRPCFACASSSLSSPTLETPQLFPNNINANRLGAQEEVSLCISK
jgi:hypothetical protein